MKKIEDWCYIAPEDVWEVIKDLQPLSETERLTVCEKLLYKQYMGHNEDEFDVFLDEGGFLDPRDIYKLLTFLQKSQEDNSPVCFDFLEGQDCDGENDEDKKRLTFSSGRNASKFSLKEAGRIRENLIKAREFEIKQQKKRDKTNESKVTLAELMDKLNKNEITIEAFAVAVRNIQFEISKI